jgi:hypothetical protein
MKRAHIRSSTMRFSPESYFDVLNLASGGQLLKSWTNRLAKNAGRSTVMSTTRKVQKRVFQKW